MKLTSHAEVIKNELAKWQGVYKNRLGRKVEKKDEKSEQLMERNENGRRRNKERKKTNMQIEKQRKQTCLR